MPNPALAHWGEALRHDAQATVEESQRLGQLLWTALNLAFSWRFTPLILTIGGLALGATFLSISHTRWRRGWLSTLIAARLSASQTRIATEQSARPMDWRRRMAAFHLTLIEKWDSAANYLRTRFRQDLLS